MGIDGCNGTSSDWSQWRCLDGGSARVGTFRRPRFRDVAATWGNATPLPPAQATPVARPLGVPAQISYDRRSVRRGPIHGIWSGQFASGTTFSAVSGNWVVPTVQPTQTTEAAGTWIGIDGGPSSPSSIIQTGTAQVTQGGQTAYYAWYEVFPSPTVVLGTVSPGDVMHTSVARDLGDQLDPVDHRRHVGR